jgi:hypothetical protein
MNGLFRRTRLAVKAFSQLGWQQAGYYAWYQLTLRSGYLRQQTPLRPPPEVSGEQPDAVLPLLSVPDKAALSAVIGQKGCQELAAEADEIIAGQVRLFGGPPVPLQLKVSGPLKHWTAYERGQGLEEHQDIKFIWEPGRFGWAFCLGRAYCLSGDERYATAFWSYSENFLKANPVNLGPHWASAQEVALRLMAFAFAYQVFRASPQASLEHLNHLRQAIAEHAARIPPTLAYARAQNNNHLLTEAAGLYTAGVFLPDHPFAQKWRALGWRWLNLGLQNQITSDGAYIQHSTNYHRLMLQVALWVQAMAASHGQLLPNETLNKLSLATRWLLSLLDRKSGQSPNLGPNDGAYILPLSTCPFSDYRPVLQAASQVFLGERPFEPGPWDEMALWLQADQPATQHAEIALAPSPITIHAPAFTPHPSWAYLRVARFTSRPGHADQLHLDLWWRGLNIAIDPGTYLYNGLPPWDNPLAQSAVHNTVTIDGVDQMLRAGRFLYLDWAQGQVVNQDMAEDGSRRGVVAEHDGYRHAGITHLRSVSVTERGDWTIEDRLLPAIAARSKPADPRTLRLHWLLPDWPWKANLENKGSRLEVGFETPYGWASLAIHSPTSGALQATLSGFQLARVGALLAGSGPVAPIQGWASPTYGIKIPALSVAVEVKGVIPLGITSQFTFPS